MNLNIPIARHQYPLGVVASSLALVLRAGTRLRRVPDVLSMSWNWSDLHLRAASYSFLRSVASRNGFRSAKSPARCSMAAIASAGFFSM